jgi:hypothetical protein
MIGLEMEPSLEGAGASDAPDSDPPRSSAGTWVVEAKHAIERRFETARPRRFWRRGFWVTARTDYRLRELPPGFEIRRTVLLGAVRRVASAPGRGRPIVILPGIYADLRESLFATVAERLHGSSGRPVLLLEDRMAAPTLAANGGEIVSVDRMGCEARELAARLPEKPDVLAFSFGAPVALRAERAWNRMVAWSATPDLLAVEQRLARSPVARLYYGWAHRRAYTGAGLEPPRAAVVYERLAAREPIADAAVATLFVHAEDDPIAPLPPVLAAARRPDADACVLPCGGHLGFGVLAGTDVYDLPLTLHRE